MELYDWQKEAIENYNGSGVVKAVTGSGKSKVGVELAKKIGGHILVASHSKPILDQWRVDMMEVPDVHFETFHILHKKPYDKKVDFLIVDEVELSTSEKFINLYNQINFENVIGLSATPNQKAIEKCGEIFAEVSMSEANVSPFIVEFHGVDLDWEEKQLFRKYSKQIQKLMEKESEEGLSEDDRKRLDYAIRNRRELVYYTQSRLPYAIDLIRSNASNGRKIIVFCQRIIQANQISDELSDIEHVLYHSRHKGNLDLFKQNKVKLLISVKGVKEGFNDIDTDCGIVVSTTLSERYNIQVIGRAIRYKENKFAKVNIMLGNETTDMKVLRHKGNYDFILNDSLKLPIISEHKFEYYKGKKFSFNTMDDFFYYSGSGIDRKRIHMIHHPIVDEVRKIKRQGGSFTISKEGVFTKVGKEIIKITDEVPILEEDVGREERERKEMDERMKRLFGG